MPNSITKNKKDEQILRNMLHAAFPEQEAENIEELTEGFFNVAYSITMENGMEVILKIAPSPDLDIMTHEENIMFAEVDSMRRLAKETEVPVAKILFYDNSHTLCNSDYFIMEKLEGSSLVSCTEMPQEQKNRIHYQTGKFNAVINSIKGSKFGYYGQPECQGANWYEVFRSMLLDTYYDAEQKNTNIKVPRDKLLKLYDQDKAIFEQVTEPKLVHWDLWAGNIFVCEDKITGLIDFERCLWADVLMEVGFRTYGDGQEKAFLEGYGMTVLSQEQLLRAVWYDIYLFLIISLEYDYRSYDDPGSYEWASKMLLMSVEKMEALHEVCY